MATKLVVLPYLQRWNGDSLDVRLLLLPRGGDPRDALVAGSSNFPLTNFTFDVRILPGLTELPTSENGSVINTQSLPAIPTASAIFDGIVVQLNAAGLGIDPTPPDVGRLAPPGANPLPIFRVRKHLPISYQDAVGYAPGSSPSLFSTDNTYSCMLKMGPVPPDPYKALPPANPLIPWGRMIAAVLRQSKLAEAAGLIRPINGIPIDPTLLKQGGYIFFSLSTTSEAAGLSPDGINTYAARIPALTESRDLFTPVLFPVTKPPPVTTPPSITAPVLDYDEIFAEVSDYDDGWAKAVHCTQPHQLSPLKDNEEDGTRPAKEMGIRIGWDDERVTTWMDRQMTTDPAVIGLDSPLGVQGYRVDVQVAKTTTWTSLTRAQGPCVINGTTYATYGDVNDELGVEVHPSQKFGDDGNDFWLPVYFTNWTGPSLVTTDNNRIKFAGGAPDTTTPKVRGIDPGLPLLYGTDYNFRVRLTDHTGGGPQINGSATNPGASPIFLHQFRRWIRPLQPVIVTKVDPIPDPQNATTSIEIKRPQLQYPAVTCTGAYPNVIQDLIAATVPGNEPGLEDPDVDRVEITVLVATLHQDPLATDGNYMPLYTTTRPFPPGFKDSVTIALQWNPINDVTDPSELDVDDLSLLDTGPLLLPEARDVRLRVGALCKDKSDYYGMDDVVRSSTVMISLRKDSATEVGLLRPPTVLSNNFNAFFLQPDLPANPSAQQAAGQAGQAPSDVPSRLASALGLQNVDMTLSGTPGRRVLFGCSPALRHTIGPDLATIAFSSKADLSLHWIIVIQFSIGRDWSWDGLAYNGLTVSRDGSEIIKMSSNYSINNKALLAPVPARSQTDLIFFDALDPKPLGGAFPTQLQPSYTISCICNGSAIVDPAVVLNMVLPVTNPPLQVPRIVSAGIAMSEYVASQDYSSTSAREKRLWIEFDAPLADPNDQYFARVLNNAPDPLLIPNAQISTVDEPPLAVDPELIRRIVPGAADDRSGIDAMQLMVPSSSSAVHFSLPLPPGFDASSPELFGFFTYEIRVGHAALPVAPATPRWSTAQGRFSAPLRVTGVQHPPPQLQCTASRTASNVINVSAPYARPFYQGVKLNVGMPRTEIWVLLYAQAQQIDGAAYRNVLLLPPTRAQLVFTATGVEPAVAHFGILAPFAIGTFNNKDVAIALLNFGFALNASLSVLAVEMMPQADFVQDPLGGDLGRRRILRTSLLTPVPKNC